MGHDAVTDDSVDEQADPLREAIAAVLRKHLRG